MRAGSVVPGPAAAEASLDGSFRLVLVLAAMLVGLVAFTGIRGALAPASGPGPSSSPSLNPAAFLEATPQPAPAISLIDQDGRPFTLAAVRGEPALVFFGYTHCPDVCPATLGLLSQVLAGYGGALHVVFVTVDPDRDTVTWLKQYVAYLPAGFTALTGSAAEIRRTADAWGVRYAKVAGSDPASYSMSHTADVFVVDPAGTLRARFPFGTQPDAMLATIRLIAASTTAPSPSPGGTGAAPSPVATPVATPAGSTPATASSLAIEVVSSAVWAGGASPVILALTGPHGRIADPAATVTAQLETTGGVPTGQPVAAVAVQPPGEATVSYVATLDIPSTGWWTVAVSAASNGLRLSGSGAISALDPGGTAALGQSAPTVRTPTLADVGGDVLRLSTDPLPDLRLYRTSSADALASGSPFVLVIDSARFRITPWCGKALGLAKFMVDRWPSVPFIQVEPFAYDVVTDTAVLRGSLADPTLVPSAAGWGIGADPWGPGSMPWVFVVDGHGTVRAKYQGIVGSDDIDIVLALIEQGG